MIRGGESKSNIKTTDNNEVHTAKIACDLAEMKIVKDI